jgi:hypothetical protein
MPDEIKETVPGTTPNEPEKTIPVDIFGETVELPLSKAKAIIAKRDEKTQGYKQLQEKVAKAEAQAKQESERASLMEAMKKSSVEEVQNLASKEYREKLEKIASRTIKKEIETALLNQDNFLKEYKDSAIKLIESEFKFSLDENYEKVVGSDGKEVKDVIQNWLDKNENYKRAKTTSGTGAKVGPGTPQVANSGFDKFVDKLIKKH